MAKLSQTRLLNVSFKKRYTYKIMMILDLDPLHTANTVKKPLNDMNCDVQLILQPPRF